MRRPLVLLALGLFGCAPSHPITVEEVQTTHDLGDVMWAQAQLCDPAFKKIGAATYSDDDYAVMNRCAERIGVTMPRAKKDFSKGPGFDTFADELENHAKDLGDAAAKKDPARASAALSSMKSTCNACHKQYR